MKILKLHVIVALLVLGVRNAFATSNGLTDLVSWDKFALMINGTRVFVLAAEFHYQRLPVPELWLDILQKIKATGFNAISVYFFWSYHESERGKFDFKSSGKDIQRLFDYAKETGLYVIVRSGPYCNAETNGGGLALWGSDGRMGEIRTSDDKYYQAWIPFVTEIGKIIAANQVTTGGPVILNQIENEYQETTYDSNHTSVIYMKQIQKAFRDAGIVVPFTHNEKGMRAQSWSSDYKNVGGAVDVYGLDSYPGGLSCTDPNAGFNIVRTYFQWFSKYSFTQPSYLAEFEGGWFSSWGGNFYDDCAAEHSPVFADVYYKNNIGQRVTLLSIYMTYGGTNWGHSAAPVVYTSYDYSAPIRETRQLTDKLLQIKLIGLFTRVSQDLLKTEMVGNGTGYSVSSRSAFSWLLRNPDTRAGFMVVQQENTRSTKPITFSATLQTSEGSIAVPNVTLDGRQSKILATDYRLGGHTILYSSADILTFGLFENHSAVLVLYLKEGQTGQFSFKGQTDLTYKVFGESSFKGIQEGGRQSFAWTQASGATVVQFSNGVLAYLLDQPTAWRFWAPVKTDNPVVNPRDQFLVLGPYLVRSAGVSDGKFTISGDSDGEATVEAFVGLAGVETIVWNGKILETEKTSYGAIRGIIPGIKSLAPSLPILANLVWKSADSLPEIDPVYDDSRWRVCNKTSSLSPTAPTTFPVLFSSDYGYYVGTKIYRGHFDGTAATGAEITSSGGLAFGWNAWLNGQFVGGHIGDKDSNTTRVSLSFRGAKMSSSGNILTVVVDYHGHDQASTGNGINNPRGILGARLLPSGTVRQTGFREWKIQGNAGGSGNIDPVRGPMNEGGLYAERLGWHLPGFTPDKKWTTSSPLNGIRGPGIQFYLANFTLNIDSGLDVPLGIELSAPKGTQARVMFWINGYQYGKFVPHIGPQTRFPVPPGIINNRGSNTIGLSLWAQSGAGARLDGVKLLSYGVYQTDVDFGKDLSYLQPLWSNRDEYA